MEMISGYDIGADRTRVALIVFSTDSHLVFDFRRYTSREQVISAISSAQRVNGGTSTYKALREARDLFNSQKRYVSYVYLYVWRYY